MVNGTLDWITFRPATAIGTVATYVAVPTFSYTGISWKGASEVVTQFNFTASKNFVLKNRPAVPSGVNYCLCIRYRVGSVVYRWKLWQEVGEVLNVPLYNGEVIKKNFVLEIWNTKNVTSVTNAAAFNIITSVISVPSNFRNLAATALATGTEVPYTDVAISGTNTGEIATGASYHWRGDDVTNASPWTSNVGSKTFVTFNDGIADSDPVVKEVNLDGSGDAAINGKYWAEIQGSRCGMKTFSGEAIEAKTVWFVLNQTAWTSGRQYFTCTDFKITQEGSSPDLRFTWLDDGSTTNTTSVCALGTPYYIKVARNGSNTVVTVYSVDGTLLDTLTRANASSSFTLTDSYVYDSGIGVTAADVKTASLLIYLTTDDDSESLTYLLSRYKESRFTINVVLNSGNAWLDNT